MKRIRRDVLRRGVEKGIYEAALNNYPEEKEWRPINIIETCEDYINNFYNLYTDDFNSEAGGAWVNNDGTIRLLIHSNLSYTLREKI